MNNRHEMSTMNEIEEIESDIAITEHNLWVAKTHVQDRQDELNKLEFLLKKEYERQNVCQKCKLSFSEINPKCPENHKVDVSRCQIT